MKVCVIILVVAVAFTSAATIKSTKNIQSKGGITPLLTLVATVDEKSYFVDTTEKRDWRTALNFCKDLGMRLATITSASQWLALTTSTVPEFHGAEYYWTDGRESQKITAFDWDHNETPVAASYLNWSRYVTSYLTCVDFRNLSENSYLSNDSCAYRAYGVLCETT